MVAVHASGFSGKNVKPEIDNRIFHLSILSLTFFFCFMFSFAWYWIFEYDACQISCQLCLLETLLVLYVLGRCTTSFIHGNWAYFAEKNFASWSVSVDFFFSWYCDSYLDSIKLYFYVINIIMTLGTGTSTVFLIYCGERLFQQYYGMHQ